MSYENEMLKKFDMPPRKKVEDVLLVSLFKHNGVIKEFASDEEVVEKIADEFNLTTEQRNAYLETIYRVENRLKRSSLWHRLLFRAADSLAKEKFISRPTETIKLTNKKEWMLTEKGFDKALRLVKIPIDQKQELQTKSFEVQKVVNKLQRTPRPENYNPFDKEKKVVTSTREYSVRTRGFRQAVIEAYDYKCAVCGLKLCSPNSLYWEVEAAHIVPHSANGKDDIWNGVSLCRLHHWAFDVGWFTFMDDFKIKPSSKFPSIPIGFGKIGDYNFVDSLIRMDSKIILPINHELIPHPKSIQWHRQNVFYE